MSQLSRLAQRAQPYGLVAVFSDLYGNAWDLIEASDRKVIRSPS